MLIYKHSFVHWDGPDLEGLKSIDSHRSAYHAVRAPSLKGLSYKCQSYSPAMLIEILLLSWGLSFDFINLFQDSPQPLPIKTMQGLGGINTKCCS